jgi:hypothetical protein
MGKPQYQELTEEEAVCEFVKHAQEYDEEAPNKRWYVGITKRDPDVWKKEHERKGVICEYFKSLVDCPEDTARILEDMLEEEGFTKKDVELEASSGTSKLSAESKEADILYHVYIYKAKVV